MTRTSNKLKSGILALAALSGSVVPTLAASWTPPGVTMGLTMGAALAPGVYVSNLTHYGQGDIKTITADIPSFTWSSGWKVLGASYSASLVLEALELHITSPVSVNKYGVFNPLLIPVILSWDLGQGFHASWSEGIYLPIDTDVAFTSAGETSGTGVETRFALSYLSQDWVMSANTILGTVTSDTEGVKQPNYFNIDWSVARKIGKWQVGAVGYGAWDIETTETNAAVGAGHTVGIGGLVGYDFGGPKLLLEATRSVDQGGATNYAKNDTHVFARMSFPIWQPSAPGGEQSASLK